MMKIIASVNLLEENDYEDDNGYNQKETKIAQSNCSFLIRTRE